jgi:hypothetical protein
VQKLNPARILLTLYAALMMLPFRYHAAAPGLDSSWAVALNLLHVQGAIHGRDFAFTYGPLSYLALPIPMGTDLEQALFFQALAWLAFSAILIWLAFSRRVPLAWLLLFAFVTVPGSGLLHWFGYAGPDYFLEITALLALAACALSGSFLFLTLAVGIGVLLIFIKLTSGLGVLLAVLAFPIGLFVFDRRRALWFEAAALLAVPAMILGFWSYEPSWPSLVRYFRSGWEISSGFTSVMGISYPGKAVPLALAMLLGYVALGALLLFWRDRAFIVFAAGVPALFIEFKHAFVREPGHVDIFFSFAPLLVGIILLASSRFRWLTLAPLAIVLAPLWLRDGAMRQWKTGPSQALHTLAAVASPTSLRQRLEAESAANLNADRLPADLLARISNRAVAIFPSECSYAAANPGMHWTPLPLLQAYSAYTQYLDDWNAQVFTQNSPDYVIFEWQAIDSRNPLLDVPATALALYRNYELDQNFGNIALLRKRTHPLAPTLHKIPFGSASPHPTIVKIQMQPTMAGRVRDLLFRTGEIDMTLTSAEGRYVVARVPPRVLANGVLFNVLPGDLEGFRQLMGGVALAQPLDDLVVAGPGIANYKSPTMELYEVLDAAIQWQPATPLPDLSHFISRGDLDTTRIETLNTEGVVGISSREVLDIPAPGGFLRLSGWVVAPPGSTVFVDMDGRLWRAQQGIVRPDIKLLYSADRAGIEWFTGAPPLGHGPHHLQLRVIDKDGKFYYSSPQNVAFRIP